MTRTSEYNLLEEEYLSFAQAARRLPSVREGGSTSQYTVARWALKGLRSDSGEHVLLEKIRIGGRNFTSMEALNRFFDKLNDGPAASKSKKQKSAEEKVDEAKEILRRRGLLR
ncbi:MAG: DUF1580 domain-containing protein [Planctomycetaceae bacterium]|nr:DUF1580 domain-containing protein [Planctomycetaceae bacterium]